MQRQPVFATFVLVTSLLLAACAPAAATQDVMLEKSPTAEMMDDTAGDAMMDKTVTPEMMDDTAGDAMMDKTGTPEMMDDTAGDAMMDKTGTPEMMDDESEMMAPAWFAAELTDVVSGEAFKIEDFHGKVVLVETFAQWCTTCLAQQKQVMKLHEMMGMSDDLVSVALDIDPNEDAEMLKKYLEKHGFDWHYAITPAETAREISNLYGAQFLNPPSAPMFIIDRQGEVHPLPFGVKSAEALQAALAPFIDADM